MAWLRKKESSINTDKVAVIGAGQFGSAICHYLDTKNFNVFAYDEIKETVARLSQTRFATSYQKTPYSERVLFKDDMNEVVENAGLIFMAVPSQHYRSAARNLNNYVSNNAVIVNLTKGMEIGTSKLMSQIIKEEVHKKHRYAALAGGMYARDVLLDNVIYADIASNDYSLATELFANLSSDSFILSPSDDVIGVEIAGPLKNIGAIMVGIAVSLKIGSSGYCGFMCEYEDEAKRIANHFNSKKGFSDLFAWRGDTMTTWFDPESRNRRFGEHLVLGLKGRDSVEDILKKEEEHGTVEGYYAAKAVYQIAKEAPHKYPILCSIYRTLYEGSSPEKEIDDLKKLFMSKVERVSKYSGFFRVKH